MQKCSVSKSYSQCWSFVVGYQWLKSSTRAVCTSRMCPIAAQRRRIKAQTQLSLHDSRYNRQKEYNTRTYAILVTDLSKCEKTTRAVMCLLSNLHPTSFLWLHCLGSHANTCCWSFYFEYHLQTKNRGSGTFLEFYCMPLSKVQNS